MRSFDFDYREPGFDIVRAAHAEYVVTDLHAARDFYVDLLGFVVSFETPDALYLRGYEERHHHSLVIRKGAQPMIGHIAFLVRAEDDLDRLAAHFDGLGLESSFVKDVEPGQGRALRVQDPLGFPAEFFSEMETEECLLQRYDLYRGAEVMRFDHFNLH
ncbi:MAG: VOC family protein, partial [Actinomycetota bacterium]